MSKSRLSVRLIVGVLTLQAIFSGILIWNCLRLLDSDCNEVWQRAIEEHSTLLAQALVTGPVLKDRAALLRTLELLQNNPLLRYAAVLNTQRELLASIGEPLPRQAQKEHVPPAWLE